MLTGKVININESSYPVVSEGSVKIVCMDEDGDKFSIDKKDLMSYLYESEDLFEAASISVVNKGVDKYGLLLVVNGKDYHYTSDSYTPKELEDKFVGIAKHSIGRAFAWVRKNAKAKESYKKDKSESLLEASRRAPWDMNQKDIKNSLDDTGSALCKLFGKVFGGLVKESGTSGVWCNMDGNKDYECKLWLWGDELVISFLDKSTREGFSVKKGPDSGKKSSALYRGLDKFINDAKKELDSKVADLIAKSFKGNKKSSLVGKNIYNAYFGVNGLVISVDYSKEEIQIKQDNGDLAVVKFSDLVTGTEGDWRLSDRAKSVIKP